MAKFKFIDLFSGIGGFHQALENLGGECVFASDIDKFAIESYKENYGLDSDHNIRDVKEEDMKKMTKVSILIQWKQIYSKKVLFYIIIIMLENMLLKKEK